MASQPVRVDLSAGGRRARDAASRFERAVATLVHLHEQTSGEQRWLVGQDAETLLWRMLLDAEALVALLPDEDDAGDLVEPAARRLKAALRDRRLGRKLSQVEGRTEQEARVFAAKARELRGQ